jgi:hypothetical protein
MSETPTDTGPADRAAGRVSNYELTAPAAGFFLLYVADAATGPQVSVDPVVFLLAAVALLGGAAFR